MADKPYLNAGCGRIILPAERPAHHAFVPENIYTEKQWINADRNATPGVDCVVDLFRYPWPWPNNHFDGALFSHIMEHVPHGIEMSIPPEDQRRFLEYNPPPHIKRFRELEKLQDGWYAWWAEAYRVLTHDARVHILSPHAHADGAYIDPSHTRYLTPTSFYHSMRPDPDAPFEYQTGGIHFEFEGNPLYGITDLYAHLLPKGDEPPDVQAAMQQVWFHKLNTHWNVASDFYVCLRAVKE